MHLLGSWDRQCKGPGAGELVGSQRRPAWLEGVGEGEEAACQGEELGFHYLCTGRPATGFPPGSGMTGFSLLKAHTGGHREKRLRVGRPWQRSLRPSQQTQQAAVASVEADGL